MSTPFPPAMTGPPITPPSVPGLSSIPFGQAPGEDAPNVAAAVPKLFFQVSQQLKTIAKVLPGYASELDDVSNQLMDIAAKAVAGSPSQNSSPNVMSSLGAESAPRPIGGGQSF